MRIKEIIEGNGPTLKNPQVQIPLTTYKKLKPQIQQIQDSNKPNTKSLTHQQRLLVARQAKIQQLANRFRQSELQSARFKPTETDIVLAMQTASR